MSGDSALVIFGPDASAEAIEALREAWGLNKPIWQQYLIYIGNIFQGDLGQSYLDGRDAIDVVAERIPKTLSLMGITAFFTFLIGIPAGIYSALHHNTAIDRSTMTLSVMGLSIPNFFLGCSFNSLVFSNMATTSQCRQRNMAALHYAGHHDGHRGSRGVRTVYTVVDAGSAQ